MVGLVLRTRDEHTDAGQAAHSSSPEPWASRRLASSAPSFAASLAAPLKWSAIPRRPPGDPARPARRFSGPSSVAWPATGARQLAPSPAYMARPADRTVRVG